MSHPNAAPCRNCRETVTSDDRLHWTHPHSGDIYCRTGDGATAYPEGIAGPWAAPSLPAWTSDPAYTTPAHPHRARNIALLIIGAFLAILTIVVVAAALGTGNTPNPAPAPAVAPSRVNLFDPATLAQAFTDTLDGRLADPNSAAYSPGVTVSNAECVRVGQTQQFNCIVELSDGNTIAPTITVATDGQSWVSR